MAKNGSDSILMALEAYPSDSDDSGLEQIELSTAINLALDGIYTQIPWLREKQGLTRNLGSILV